ncbi:MAG: diaminopimelate epimerase [Cyclobacteriaceae bacterium]
MKLHFHKYQGTGNDFVIVDNRSLSWLPTTTEVKNICDRKFGVGADGLMLIQSHSDVDFEMVYYNSDGSKSLCGNGSRCAIHFAKSINIIGDSTTFLTTDGIHKGSVKEDAISFQLFDVDEIQKLNEDYFINTGSPHFIRFVDNIESCDVFETGKAIRYSEQFSPDGTNVNFVSLESDGIFVRTYERGVEAETLSCGTGVTAAAIAANLKGLGSPIKIETLGGTLNISFTKTASGTYQDIYLTGPATPVFIGEINLP